MYLVIKTQR